jgi:hypothetical protein
MSAHTGAKLQPSIRLNNLVTKENGSDMNIHRKLLIYGLNKILADGLLSLDENDHREGHLIAELMGKNSVVIWAGISAGEVRLSVWWDYDHAKHPQANNVGNSRESFTGTSPLAKSQHYPKFVGAFVSGWLERETAKHLQGKGGDGLFETYTRRGMKDALISLPNPMANGYLPEGKFFL